MSIFSLFLNYASLTWRTDGRRRFDRQQAAMGMYAKLFFDRFIVPLFTFERWTGTRLKSNTTGRVWSLGPWHWSLTCSLHCLIWCVYSTQDLHIWIVGICWVHQRRHPWSCTVTIILLKFSHQRLELARLNGDSSIFRVGFMCDVAMLMVWNIAASIRLMVIVVSLTVPGGCWNLLLLLIVLHNRRKILII